MTAEDRGPDRIVVREARSRRVFLVSAILSLALLFLALVLSGSRP